MDGPISSIRASIEMFFSEQNSALPVDGDLKGMFFWETTAAASNLSHHELTPLTVTNEKKLVR